MNKQQKTKTQGFTLVELSIVIIIIGFLIAGVSAGQSLIKQAASTAALSEMKGIQLAVQNFKVRFDNQLPGDLSTASAYWPNCAPTPDNGIDNSLACNGDGDGTFAGPGSTAYEIIGAWNHLALAGLISGITPHQLNLYYANSYCGGCVGGVGDTDALPSKYVNGALYSLYPSTPFSDSAENTYVIMSTAFYETGGKFITAYPWGGLPQFGVPLTTNEAQAIDIKGDDGIPTSGIVRANNGWINQDNPLWIQDCISGASYLLTNTVKACYLGYQID